MAWLIALTCIVPAVAQDSAGSIAVFDSSVVFDRSQHGEVLKAEIERLRDRKVQEMSAVQESLSALQEEFRNKEMTFNDDRRSELLESINQKQIELKRMNDDSQRALQAEFNRAQQKLQTELIEVVEQLGEEGQYLIIIEKGLTLYASPTIDITPRVLAKFDEVYPYPVGTGGGQ